MNKDKIFDLLNINGGFSKNIRIKKGNYGLGVYAQNSSKKVELFLPKKLLIDSSKLTLDINYNLKINDNNNDELVKKFFKLYFENYGFNINTKKDIDIFLKNLNNLSILLKDYLKFFFNKIFFEHKFTQKDYLNLYLNSRQIKIQNKNYFMPLIELINHSTEGTEYFVSEGLYVKGFFQDEIFANYNSYYDSFEFFKNYHFFSKQKKALSCKLEVKYRNKKILIERNSNEYKLIKNIKVPLSGIIDKTIFISHIDLSEVMRNKIYLELITEDLIKYGLKYSDANEFLNNLFNYNMNLLYKIKNESIHQSNSVAREINKIVDNQILCLSNK
tara:strand:- start:496 stop:1485 length:990 start_codon:yes stop_codon:yes gene_type:complete